MKRTLPWCAFIFTVLVGSLWACPNSPLCPIGIIECKQQWNNLHGVSMVGLPAIWTGNDDGVLVDVGVLDRYWLNPGVTTLSSIHGAAHAGYAGVDQNTANERVISVQIWGWRDSNGNGQADPGGALVPGDRTTKWVLLREYNPSLGQCNVVGWNVGALDTSGHWHHSPTFPRCTSALGDVLQTNAGGSVGGTGGGITINPKESWLLLIRVVDVNGYTNLQTTPGEENWFNGDPGNPVGSGVPTDMYIDHSGKWCAGAPAWKQGQQAIPDESVVWVYAPKN